MEFYRKTILLLIFSSFMSVGWGQDCGNVIEIDSIEEICNLTDLSEINLSESNLTGEIPSCIGNLINLTCLSLSSNELTGEIPPEIGNLMNLTELYLGNNQLTGEIPSEIGNMINLERLLLHDNQLSGEISQEVCNFNVYINIDNNQLCPPYPDCLSEEDIGYQDTSNCEEPSLCEDGYTEIDGECYYQSDLDVLQDFIDLNQSLNGEEPLEIGDQEWYNTRLTYLGLGNRSLTTIPDNIGNLNHLEYLFLSSNQFSILPENIGNLSSLKFLFLSHNQFSILPESIGNLSSLETLYLHSNQLFILPDTICNLSDCYIYVNDNQLCLPYPECLTEGDIGYQDTSECEEPDAQIGDECVMQDGLIGFYDCELCCWDEWIIENWLGDGWCDYLGGCGFEGPLFNCPELGYDCGDCTEDWDGTDPSGLCSNDCLFPGDVNSDSILNILDIVSMITLILDGEYDECGDVNSDGDLNILDVVTFVNIILSIP